MDKGTVTFDFGSGESFAFPSNPISANFTDFGVRLLHVWHDWETITIYTSVGDFFHVEYSANLFKAFCDGVIKGYVYEIELVMEGGDTEAVTYDITIG